MPKQDVQGPAKDRYLKSYEIRRAYADAIQYPPEVPGVKDVIDVHWHCDQGIRMGLRSPNTRRATAWVAFFTSRLPVKSRARRR
jgi:hypothetical protein